MYLTKYRTAWFCWELVRALKQSIVPREAARELRCSETAVSLLPLTSHLAPTWRGHRYWKMKMAGEDHCGVCLLHNMRGSKTSPTPFPHCLVSTRANVPVLGHGYATPNMFLVNGQYKSPSHYFMRLISYLQGFFGSLSREIARFPQGHLKNRLMASCHW